MTFLKAILYHLCGLERGPDYKLENCQLIVIKKLLFQLNFRVFCLKISNWQTAIDNEPIIFDGINTDHKVLKGDIHSLYQEALYARVTDKLSYDIIGLVALIDRVNKQQTDISAMKNE